MEEKEKTGSS